MFNKKLKQEIEKFEKRNDELIREWAEEQASKECLQDHIVRALCYLNQMAYDDESLYKAIDRLVSGYRISGGEEDNPIIIKSKEILGWV